MAQVRPERAARRTDGLTDGLVRLRPRLRRPRDSRPGGGGSRRAAMAADSREEKGERGGWGPRAAGEGTGEPRRAGGRAGGAGGAGLASSGRSRGLASSSRGASHLGQGSASARTSLRTLLVAVPGAVGREPTPGCLPPRSFPRRIMRMSCVFSELSFRSKYSKIMS